MHELTTPFALRTAQALMDAALALAYEAPHGVAREAAERAREAMAIEAGKSGSSYCAAERLMLFVGDVRWLSSVLYDEHDDCRFPLDRIPPFHRLPAAHDLSRLTWDMGEAERGLMRSRDDRRPTDAASLLYLAARLESADSVDTRAMARKIRAVLSGAALAESEKEEFYGSLWTDVTRVLDRGDFAPEHRDLLSAVEAELAGHVHGLRLLQGKLVRREFVLHPQPKPRGIFRRLFAH